MAVAGRILFFLMLNLATSFFMNGADPATPSTLAQKIANHSCSWGAVILGVTYFITNNKVANKVALVGCLPWIVGSIALWVDRKNVKSDAEPVKDNGALMLTAVTAGITFCCLIAVREDGWFSFGSAQ